MDSDVSSASFSYIAGVKITDVLRVEHRLLRVLMAQTGDWLAEGAPPAAMRERATLLDLALETHAQREERQLFEALRPINAAARDLVDMMVIVHDEVRSLFGEIAASAEPIQRLWTILDLTETHFGREDREVFPLAEALIDPATLHQLGTEESAQ